MKHRIVGWTARLAKAARAARTAMRSPAGTMVINAPLEAGHVEVLAIEADGTVSVTGWADDLTAFRDALVLTLDGAAVNPTYAYRVRRPDLVPVLGSEAAFRGSVIEWVTGPRARTQHAELKSGGRTLAAFELLPIDAPAYAHLQTEPRVLGRDHIYGSGPPVPHVSPELLELARTLPPPVLDFGCGAGALVRALRAEGVEAYGLELDDERIREHLLDDVRPWVTLYDGTLPSPFHDGQFRSVCCAEVIEHIENPARIVTELARLATSRVLITVPDISAIPRGYYHSVVPWHLLEATHVNFFTQRSLESLVAPVASRLEAARIGRVVCDRLSFYTSLAVLIER